MAAKFKVGQVVIYERGKKRDIPVKILEVVEMDGAFFYRFDRKNCFDENMVRAQTPEEAGYGEGKN